MRIHELKCRTDYFEALIAGEKPFEVRKNDRPFEVGDYLALNEVQAEDSCVSEDLLYTGRCWMVQVSYILADSEYCKEGYVILGVRPCRVNLVDPAHAVSRFVDLIPGVGGNG